MPPVWSFVCRKVIVWPRRGSLGVNEMSISADGVPVNLGLGLTPSWVRASDHRMVPFDRLLDPASHLLPGHLLAGRYGHGPEVLGVLAERGDVDGPPSLHVGPDGSQLGQGVAPPPLELDGAGAGGVRWHLDLRRLGTADGHQGGCQLPEVDALGLALEEAQPFVDGLAVGVREGSGSLDARRVLPALPAGKGRVGGPDRGSLHDRLTRASGQHRHDCPVPGRGLQPEQVAGVAGARAVAGTYRRVAAGAGRRTSHSGAHPPSLSGSDGPVLVERLGTLVLAPW